MKTKQAEQYLKKVLDILNQHPSESEFTITKKWEKKLKKIINFLLFFTSDIKIENKDKINKLNKIKRKIVKKESELEKIKKEEKISIMNLEEVEKELITIKNYIKIKNNLEKYQDTLALLKNDLSLYNLIKNESNSFLSSMSNIENNIKELEAFITEYIKKSDKEKEILFKTID